MSAYTGEELAKYTTVTLPEARAIALKAFPGKITDEELEKEKGGSGLRYSFDIEDGGVTHEVGVDAETGKLLEKRRRPTSRLRKSAKNVPLLEQNQDRD